MEVKLNLPDIEGFEYTGEYRAPKENEWFLDGTNTPHKYVESFSSTPPFPILKKKVPVYMVVDLPPMQDSSMEVIKFAEIKALEDAFSVMKAWWPTNLLVGGNNLEIFRAIEELIKQNQPKEK